MGLPRRRTALVPDYFGRQARIELKVTTAFGGKLRQNTQTFSAPNLLIHLLCPYYIIADGSLGKCGHPKTLQPER